MDRVWRLRTVGHGLHLKFLVGAMCGLLVVSMVVLPKCADRATTLSDTLETTMGVEERTVDYRWYDFFDVPYGEWWDYRVEMWGIDTPTTDSYPYLNRHFYNESSFDTFSGARLNVTARSLPEVNMNARPVFLPLLSGEANPGGGTAVIDWYIQYLTYQEYRDRVYAVPSEPYIDGWLVSLNGTARLDEAGAMSVMGITSEDFDDFETWWAANRGNFTNDHLEWLLDEGNDRLDIFCMYDYEFVPARHVFLAEKVGEEIVLTFDTLGWGIEALMTRWLKDAFMPTEWWFEDFTMHAEIGPDCSDIDIDTAVAFAVRAAETKDLSEPCWVWQGMLQDHRASSSGHYFSSFDPYSDKTRLCQSPGSQSYGEMIPYTDTPGCYNLSEGESLVFCWPTEDILFLDHVDTMVTDNVTAPTIVSYSEPHPSDMTDSIDYSPASRTIEFRGPLDFWSWSKDQDTHENLSDEWDRLGLLPCGMPYLELSYWGPDTPPIAAVEARLSPGATSASQYVLDASQSCDSEDSVEDLEFRWDFDGDGTMDIDWVGEPVIEHDFGGAGTFEVTVLVKDTDEMTDESTIEVTVAEVDPPTTTASVKGDEGTNGWFTSEITVSLSAEDASGVECTYYVIDGGAWEEYVGEFEIASDGEHTLAFHSVDTESNAEEAQDLAVKIDSVAPVASFVTDAPVHASDKVTVNWSLSDETSGAAYSVLILDGGTPITIGSAIAPGPAGPATSYTLEGVEEGQHSLVLIVYDYAGNSDSDTYVFSVDLEDPMAVGPHIWLIVFIAAAAVIAILVAILLLNWWKHRPPAAS